MFLCDPNSPLGSGELVRRILPLRETFPSMVRAWTKLPEPSYRKRFYVVELAAMANTAGGFVIVGLSHRNGQWQRTRELRYEGIQVLLESLPPQMRTPEGRVSVSLVDDTHDPQPLVLLRVPRLEIDLAQLVIDGTVRVPVFGETGGAKEPTLEKLAATPSLLVSLDDAKRRQLALRDLLNPVVARAADRFVEQLEWVVLPPGWLLLLGRGEGRHWHQGSLEDADYARLGFIDSLSPERWYAGKRLGRTQYFVAEFAGIVVADAPQIGNAIYILRDSESNWRHILSRTKPEAIHAGAERLFHVGGWKERLAQIIASP